MVRSLRTSSIGATPQMTMASPFLAGSLSFPHMPFTAPQYPREIVFLGGAPWSGKGTNSSHIARLRNFTAPTIVISDLLNTPACRLLKDRGMMVDDDFVFNALQSELQNPIYRNGVVVDGFPRTAAQAEYLTNFYDEQCSSLPFLSSAPRVMFVMLHVDEASSIQRQQERGRKITLQNRTQAALGMPVLEVRQTDIDIKASQARYQVFKQQLDAVMELSEKFPLVVVDASAEVEEVRFNLAHKMASLPPSL